MITTYRNRIRRSLSLMLIIALDMVFMPIAEITNRLPEFGFGLTY